MHSLPSTKVQMAGIVVDTSSIHFLSSWIIPLPEEALLNGPAVPFTFSTPDGENVGIAFQRQQPSQTMMWNHQDWAPSLSQQPVISSGSQHGQTEGTQG